MYSYNIMFLYSSDREYRYYVVIKMSRHFTTFKVLSTTTIGHVELIFSL